MQNTEAELVSFPAPADRSNHAQASHAADCSLSADDVRKIREAIRAKYVDVSRSPAGRFLYPTGREGAGKLGYDPTIIERAPAELLESFCGVGNPFSLGDILPGQSVLDFGCGGGFDMFVSSGIVGAGGLVCGIDLTENMVRRATDNLLRAGLKNFEIRHVDAEEIPYGNDFFNVVISNGVINLSPCKQHCFREIHRVLKPGGKIYFADVVLEKELPGRLTGSAEAWAQ